MAILYIEISSALDILNKKRLELQILIRYMFLLRNLYGATKLFSYLSTQFGMECLRQLISIAQHIMGHSWDIWGQKIVTNLHYL